MWKALRENRKQWQLVISQHNYKLFHSNPSLEYEAHLPVVMSRTMTANMFGIGILYLMNDFGDLSWSAAVDSGGFMEGRRKTDFKTRLLKQASNYDRSLSKAVWQDRQIRWIIEKVQNLPDGYTFQGSVKSQRSLQRRRWSRSGASARKSILKREREKLIKNK